MRLKELGELSIVKRLEKRLERTHPRILKAIGDDTAVALIDGNRCLLATTDTLVEGVHFKRDYTPPYHLGRKLVSISLSDVAAMGGSPLFLLVSIALPGETTVEFLDEFYEGIEDCADEAGVFLVGGNTSSSREIVVTGVMLAESPKKEVVYRSGARSGDIIYVTGTVGDSALGRKILKKRGGSALKRGPFKKAVMKHLNPAARVAAGRVIAQKKLATSMIDISDGVLADLRHIACESAKGARIEMARLPLSDDLIRHLRENPADWELPLTGGEDYELLFTADPEKGREISLVGKRLGIRITPIGEILGEGGGVTVMGRKERPIHPRKEGYEHFR